jgi:hypothetical protein
MPVTSAEKWETAVAARMFVSRAPQKSARAPKLRRTTELLGLLQTEGLEHARTHKQIVAGT